MSEDNFEQAKQDYAKCREEERGKISDYLKNNLERLKHNLQDGSLRVVDGPGAGKGISNYKSGNRMAPFNLSNWKWIEIKYVPAEGDEIDEFLIISLQPPETDPKSNNRHVLMDRIGVRFNGHWMITDIDLPVDEESLERLVDSLDFLLQVENIGRKKIKKAGFDQSGYTLSICRCKGGGELFSGKKGFARIDKDC